MKSRKTAGALRGFAAIFACLFLLSSTGTAIANSFRSALDGVLGTNSYISVDNENSSFVSDYATIDEMIAAARDISVREGEEGTVIMKNDNDALPLSTDRTVVLFGLAAYAPYPYAAGDLKAGNADAVDLLGALEGSGFKVNETVRDLYLNNILNKHIEQVPNAWTGELVDTVAYDNIYESVPGDMQPYTVNEITSDRFAALGVDEGWAASIDKDSSTAIVVFARGAGEGNNYMPGSAMDSQGNATGEDPLKLSAEELAVVDLARETCGKVVVLINSGNNMVIGDIAAGGEHEVDGIAYIGCINDYQCEGIVNVLSGKVNATGALPDTYVRDNASLPAMQNFGGDNYADADTLVSHGDDPRWPGVEIANNAITSFEGGSTYNAGSYIVEAEGIYVGYKYYETRYYDSIVNPDSNAASAKGATQSETWDYDAEVVYPFGHGLSYLDYTQTIKSVDVDNTEDGNITAVVEIANHSDQDGRFLAQLYVQQPYTEYDRTNLVEKSAVMFLSSGKTEVKAGDTAEVTITVPTKYLASYDYTAAKTYILDEGDYYFTAAAGAHEAVKNIMAAQGHDTDASGACVTWNLASFDSATFATDNGTAITNVADTADMNYWLPGSVTYLSRADWDATWPLNYNTDVSLKLADSEKKDEWIATLRGQVYTLKTDGTAVEGENKSLLFGMVDDEQLKNIDDPYWNELVSQILIDEAVGAVIHGGSRAERLTNVENTIVFQNEGVSGFTSAYVDEASGTMYKFNIHSQTLLGASFNPELAYDWGRVEGNSGIWLKSYHLWGTGLTLRRTPYNGRNYEYISEDPMLTNRIGCNLLQGCADKGIINGPKHMGFNDQEHNRAGIAVYMTEQKFRETDLRGFQGGLSDAFGMGVMIAFNRIGPTNACMFVPMMKNILRDEWGYKGLISTDMATNPYYFDGASMVAAGVTQVADFATDDNHINQGDGGVDKTWPYISLATVSKDPEFVEMARQNLKYQLYIFSNSAVLNSRIEKVNVWWDSALSITKNVSAGLACICALGWIAVTLLGKKKEGN